MEFRQMMLCGLIAVGGPNPTVAAMVYFEGDGWFGEQRVASGSRAVVEVEMHKVDREEAKPGLAQFLGFLRSYGFLQDSLQMSLNSDLVEHFLQGEDVDVSPLAELDLVVRALAQGPGGEALLRVLADFASKVAFLAGPHGMMVDAPHRGQQGAASLWTLADHLMTGAVCELVARKVERAERGRATCGLTQRYLAERFVARLVAEKGHGREADFTTAARSLAQMASGLPSLLEFIFQVEERATYARREAASSSR